MWRRRRPSRLLGSQDIIKDVSQGLSQRLLSTQHQHQRSITHIAMAHALITFDGASMQPGVRAVFASANVPYEIAPLIVVAEHAGSRTLCDGLTMDHVADMNFGTFATTQRAYATFLIGLRDGVPAVAAVAAVPAGAGQVAVAAIAAVDGVPGVGGLAGVVGTPDECADEILHPLMRLHRAARNELARLAPGGSLTAEKLADAMGGQAVADKPVHRVRTLDEAAVASLLAAGYLGRLRPDFPWARPGNRLVSVMAHHSAALPDAGVRRPRVPSYKDAPFDAVVSEDGTLIHNPSHPTAASLLGAFSVFFLAWELCASQVPKPADFAGTGARLSGDVAAYKAVIIALHRLKDIDPGPLLEQLKLLQEQMHHWSEGIACDGWYPKAVERLEAIRYVIASRAGAAVVAAVVSPDLVAPSGEGATPKGSKRPLKEGTPESRQLAHVQRENEALRAKLAKTGQLGKSGKGGGKGSGGWYDAGYGKGAGHGGYGFPPPQAPPGAVAVVPKCNDFIAGRCMRGANCRYAHN